MKPKNLASDREAIILSILIGRERYGREIRNEYEERTNSKIPLGSLYTTLIRMEEQKGYVRSREGESTPGRQGNRRRYYIIKASGTRALRDWELYRDAVRGATRSDVAPV